MARLEYTAEGYPFYVDDGNVTPGDGTQLERVLPVVASDDDAFTKAAARLYRGVKSEAREGRAPRIVDLLAGGNPEVERYQTWPEKMVRSAVTLPYDAMTGRVPDTEAVMEPNALATFLGADPRSTWSVPAQESMIGRVQDLAGLAIGGPLTAPRGGATLRSGLERPDIGGGPMPANRNVAPANREAMLQEYRQISDRAEREERNFTTAEAKRLNQINALTTTRVPFETLDAAARDQFGKGYWHLSPEEMKSLKIGGVSFLAEGGRVAAPLAGLRERAQAPIDRMGVKTPVEQVAPTAIKFWEESGMITPEEANVIRQYRNWPTSQPAPVFYSAVEHAVNNARQQSATPDQWLGFLRNQPGVKAEELQWMGLDDWLKSQKGPVRKEQIDEFVKNNKVEIKTVEKSQDKHGEFDDENIGGLADTILHRWEGGTPRWTIEPSGFGPNVFRVVDQYGHVAGDMLDKRHATMTKRDMETTIAERDPDAMMELSQEVAENTMRSEGGEGGGSPVRYSEYQLPGGDNYRELLLTLPEKTNALQRAEQRYAELVKVSDKRRLTSAEEAEWNAVDDQISRLRQQGMHGIQSPDATINYRTSHWDEPNVLAHVRVNDRYIGGGKGEALDNGLTVTQVKDFNRWAPMTLEQRQRAGVQEAYEKLLDQQDKWAAGWRPESARTLFLEEVQSDWHQAGRKQGYTSPVTVTKRELSPEEAHRAGFAYVEEKPETRYIAERNGRMIGVGATEAEARQYAATASPTVPDAPFKTTWPDLVLKRMVREAAENGYDQIAWTPGEVQAARYDLSKQIKDLRYEKTDKGYNLGANKDPNTWVEHHIGDNIPEAKLADYVGKDVADKIIRGQGKNSEHGGKVLSGVDLKVGGEGMKSFYDKMLVDKANALGKKFGAKVEKQAMLEQFEVMEVGRGGVDGTHPVYMVTRPDAPAKEFATRAEAERWVKDNAPTVWVMKITPKMREAAVDKGFPLFSAGLPFQFERVDHDPFATQYQSPLFRTEPVDHDPFGVLPYDPNRT